MQFTLEGRRRFGHSRRPRLETSCPTCGGRGVALSPAVARLRRGLAALADAAPPPLVELDQCHCTPKTKLRRVLAMHEAGAIGGRRILLLGDDDLMSVAPSASPASSALAIEELVVLDLDSRLLEFIRSELEGAPFPSRLRWDALRAAPGFACRPRSTPWSPIRRTRSRPHDCFSRVRSRRSRRRQRLPLLRITETRRDSSSSSARSARSASRSALEPDFNHYVGAGALGGTSQLYHLVATGQLRPVVIGTFAGPIYTASVRSPVTTGAPVLLRSLAPRPH